MSKNFVKVAINSDGSKQITEGPIQNSAVAQGLLGILDGWYPVIEIYGSSIDHSTQVWQVSNTDFGTETVTINYIAVDKPLDTLKAMYLDEATARRYGYENDGFYYNGNWYNTSRDVRPILLSTIWVEGLTWKTRDGSFVTFNDNDFSDLKNKINNFVQASFAKEASLHDEIASATTVSELIAIDKLSGWPDKFYPSAPPPPTPIQPPFPVFDPIGTTA